jgi:hypothetical protein
MIKSITYEKKPSLQRGWIMQILRKKDITHTIFTTTFSIPLHKAYFFSPNMSTVLTDYVWILTLQKGNNVAVNIYIQRYYENVFQHNIPYSLLFTETL